VFGLNPDLILIHKVAIAADGTGIPARLIQDPKLADTYELRYTLAGAVLVYERRDAPRKQRLDVPPGLAVVEH